MPILLIKIFRDKPSLTRPWHASEEFKKIAEDFHDTYAVSPPQEISDKAKEQATAFVVEVTGNLKDVVEKEVEPQGSAFEFTKTVSSDPRLELDFLIYLKTKLEIIADDSDSPACYAKLILDNKGGKGAKTQGEENLLERCINVCRDNPRYISSKLALSQIKDQIRHMQFSENMNRYEFGREHGPALMFSIKHADTHEAIHIDLAFGILIPDDSCKYPAIYVPAAWYMQDHEAQFLWRRGYIKEEKVMLRHMTEEQLKTYRMMKAIRDRHGDLDDIKTYYFKNTLIKLVIENYDYLSGELKVNNCLSEHTALNVVHFLKVILYYLNSKCLPHHMVAAHDLFEGMSWKDLKSLAYKIRKLITDKDEMYRVMQVQKQ